MTDDYRGEKRWCVAPNRTDLRTYERAFLLIEEFFDQYHDDLPLSEETKREIKTYKEDDFLGDEGVILSRKFANKELSYDEAAWFLSFCYQFEQSQKLSGRQLNFSRNLSSIAGISLNEAKTIAEKRLKEDEANTIGALSNALLKEIGKYGNLVTPVQISRYTGLDRKRYYEIINMDTVPKKGTVYSLAYFFRLSLEETRKWLGYAGYTSFNTIPDLIFELSLKNKERGFASFCMACIELRTTILSEGVKIQKNLITLDRIITSSKRDEYLDGDIVDYLQDLHRDPRDYGFEKKKRLNMGKLLED